MEGELIQARLKLRELLPGLNSSRPAETILTNITELGKLLLEDIYKLNEQQTQTALLTLLYIKGSPHAKELFELLETGKNKHNVGSDIVRLAIQAIALIMHSLNTLHKYDQERVALFQPRIEHESYLEASQRLCDSLWKTHQGVIYSLLESGDKKYKLAAMQALLSFVGTSTESARMWIKQFEFDNMSFVRLNFYDEMESEFGNFLNMGIIYTGICQAFLSFKDPQIISDALQVKGLMFRYIQAIYKDRDFVQVSSLLKTLQESVLELPGVSNSSKCFFFTNGVLEICAKMACRELSSKQDLRPVISLKILNHLLEFCLSPVEPSINQLRLLSRVIGALRLSDHKQSKSLGLSILKRHPRSRHLFMSNINHSYEPKVSFRWFANMSLLCDIWSLDITPSDFKAISSQILTLVFPKSWTKQHISQALQQPNPLIQLTTIRTLTRCLLFIKKLLAMVSVDESDNIQRDILRLLPGLSTVLNVRNAIEKKFTNSNPSYRDQIIVLFASVSELLSIFPEIIPASKSESPVDFFKLFNDSAVTYPWQTRKWMITSLEYSGTFVSLSRLVKGFNPANKSSTAKQGTLIRCLCRVVKDLDIVTVKRFFSMVARMISELFPSSEFEVDIWLMHLVRNELNDQLISLLESCLYRISTFNEANLQVIRELHCSKLTFTMVESLTASDFNVQFLDYVIPCVLDFIVSGKTSPNLVSWISAQLKSLRGTHSTHDFLSRVCKFIDETVENSSKRKYSHSAQSCLIQNEEFFREDSQASKSLWYHLVCFGFSEQSRVSFKNQMISTSDLFELNPVFENAFCDFSNFLLNRVAETGEQPPGIPLIRLICLTLSVIKPDKSNALCNLDISNLSQVNSLIFQSQLLARPVLNDLSSGMLRNQSEKFITLFLSIIEHCPERQVLQYVSSCCSNLILRRSICDRFGKCSRSSLVLNNGAELLAVFKEQLSGKKFDLLLSLLRVEPALSFYVKLDFLNYLLSREECEQGSLSDNVVGLILRNNQSFNYITVEKLAIQLQKFGVKYVLNTWVHTLESVIHNYNVQEHERSLNAYQFLSDIMQRLVSEDIVLEFPEVVCATLAIKGIETRFEFSKLVKLVSKKSSKELHSHKLLLLRILAFGEELISSKKRLVLFNLLDISTIENGDLTKFLSCLKILVTSLMADEDKQKSSEELLSSLTDVIANNISHLLTSSDLLNFLTSLKKITSIKKITKALAQSNDRIAILALAKLSKKSKVGPSALQQCINFYFGTSRKDDVEIYNVCKSLKEKSNPLECSWGPTRNTGSNSMTFRSRSFNWIFQYFETNILLEGPDERFDNHMGINSDHKSYDPRSVLPLFKFCVEHREFLDIKKFVEHGCLSYCIMCTASQNMTFRMWAYDILAISCELLFPLKSLFEEQAEVALILHTFMSSITEHYQRLEWIVASFFAQSLTLMFCIRNPAMQLIVRRLLLLRKSPSINLEEAPFWYAMFFGSEPNRQVPLQSNEEIMLTRSWILNAFRLGLREKEDFDLLSQRRGFETIMSYFLSSGASHQEKKDTVAVLRQVAFITNKSCMIDLVKKHGILSWFSMAVRNVDLGILQRLVSLLKSLCEVLFRQNAIDDSVIPSMKLILSTAIPMIRERIAMRDDVVEDWEAAVLSLSRGIYSTASMEERLSLIIQGALVFDTESSTKLQINSLWISTRFLFQSGNNVKRFLELSVPIWMNLLSSLQSSDISTYSRETQNIKEIVHEWLKWLSIHKELHGDIFRGNMLVAQVCCEMSRVFRTTIPEDILQTLTSLKAE